VREEDYESLKKLSREEFQEYLKALTVTQQLELLELGMKDLEKSVEAASESLQKNFSKQLELQDSSRKEMEALLVKVMVR
jgi:hypothetical protein